MAIYIESYTVSRKGLADYPRYFLDVVKELVADHKGETAINVQDHTHLPNPRIFLSSENKNHLGILKQAIDSEIRPSPFSHAISIPIRHIEDKSRSECKRFWLELSELALDSDYQMSRDVEDGEERAKFYFHRTSIQKYFGKLVGSLYDATDPEHSKSAEHGETAKVAPFPTEVTSRPVMDNVVVLADVRARAAANLGRGPVSRHRLT